MFLLLRLKQLLTTNWQSPSLTKGWPLNWRNMAKQSLFYCCHTCRNTMEHLGFGWHTIFCQRLAWQWMVQVQDRSQNQPKQMTSKDHRQDSLDKPFVHSFFFFFFTGHSEHWSAVCSQRKNGRKPKPSGLWIPRTRGRTAPPTWVTGKGTIGTGRVQRRTKPALKPMFISCSMEAVSFFDDSCNC